MNKFISFMLAVVLLFCFTGCSEDSTDISCSSCKEDIPNNSLYCPYCGSSVIFDVESDNSDDNAETIVDYSDFGFQNNYGMTEWIGIYGYIDFGDPNNPFVLAKESVDHFYIMKFENGYLNTRSFIPYTESANNYKGYYKDNFEDGKFCDLHNYSIVSNNLISMPDGSSYEIEKIELENNIPIITIKLHCEEYHNDYTIEYGRFIPKEFIDFGREPELYEAVNENQLFATEKYTHIKYYIKSEYLK